MNQRAVAHAEALRAARAAYDVAMSTARANHSRENVAAVNAANEAVRALLPASQLAPRGRGSRAGRRQAAERRALATRRTR